MSKNVKVKACAIFVLLAMFITVLAPVYSISATDTKTVYFMNDFNSFAVGQLPNWTGNWDMSGSYQYWNNEIAGSVSYIRLLDQFSNNKALEVTNQGPLKFSRGMADNLAITDPSVTHYVYEWDMMITDFSENWHIEPFLHLYNERNGQLSSTDSYFGKLYMHQWAHIAVEVDKATRIYEVYVNRIKVYGSMLPAGQENQITLRTDNVTKACDSSMMFDNFTAYSGTYDNAIPMPATPSNAVWFNNDFTGYRPTDFDRIITTTGFLGLPSGYQNYYLEVAPLSGAKVDFPTDTMGRAMRITRDGSVDRDAKLYRFADDNIGPNDIKNGGTFTYEMDLKVSDGTYWDIGFLVDRTSNSTPELIGINHNRFDYPKVQITPGTWSHIALEVDLYGGSYKVYQAGVLKATAYMQLPQIKAFMIKSNNQGTGSIYVDNVKAYPGAYRG